MCTSGTPIDWLFEMRPLINILPPCASCVPCACRVEIVDWDGQVLRSFGLDECEGAPHDARIVRRSSLVGALRSAIPPCCIRYGVSVTDVHTHEQGIAPPVVH